MQAFRNRQSTREEVEEAAKALAIARNVIEKAAGVRRAKKVANKKRKENQEELLETNSLIGYMHSKQAP